MKFLYLLTASLMAIAAPAHAQCGGQGIILFSAHWCPACRATEQFLANYDIEYIRYEVSGNQQVQQFMREQYGTIAIPVIVVDGIPKVGYSAAWLREALCLR